MSRKVTESPSVDEARSLHDRLLNHDPTAPSAVATAFLDLLAEWLHRHNPGADPHDCDTAAEDALLNYIKHPASYRPERQTLEVYLRLSARGDFRNLLRRERRHTGRRVNLEHVEYAPLTGKSSWEEDDPAVVVERREMLASRMVRSRRVTDAVMVGLSPGETKVLDLMQNRVRPVAAYAVALGITDLPVEEQRKQVKRVKDRLNKRLQRAGDDDA